MPEESMENPPLRTPRHRVVTYLVLMALMCVGMLSTLFLPSGWGTSYQNPNPTPAIVEQGQAKLPVAEYAITRADGKIMPFLLEQATTLEQQEKGLMLRTTMEANEGMIFKYEKEEIRQMWMRNTILPLDILFMSANGTITDIAANTTPFSEEILTSALPAHDVIELRAGVTQAYDIRIGDHVKVYKANAMDEKL